MTAAREYNKKFGKKILDLFKLINEDENWEKYVQPNTANVVKTMYKLQSFIDAERELDMKTTTIRSHLLRALSRIEEKKTDHKRDALGDLSIELFRLVDSTENWKDYVTNHEVELVETYRDVKNFYEVARLLGLNENNAGNIAGTLYGTTQKIGVIGKLRQGIPQSERRNID